MAFSSGSFSEVPFSTNSGTPYCSSISESATGSETVSTIVTFLSSVIELATGSDAVNGTFTVFASVVELATGLDAASSLVNFPSTLAVS